MVCREMQWPIDLLLQYTFVWSADNATITAYVTLHGKTVNKVNARARHVSTLKQKERDSTR